VYGRVWGDGFPSGLFYGPLAGNPAEQALRLDWAQSALLAISPRGMMTTTVDQVGVSVAGGFARMKRCLHPPWSHGETLILVSNDSSGLRIAEQIGGRASVHPHFCRPGVLKTELRVGPSGR
jgi:hypothetical protein